VAREHVRHSLKTRLVRVSSGGVPKSQRK
jgi:hypothetical protein